MTDLRQTAALAATLLCLLCPPAALAHNPICNCYAEPDNQVLCEGGFSDGASAEGVEIRVLDDRERVLLEGKMDADSVFVFDRPDVFFHVVFDAGDSHEVVVYEDEIE